MHRPRTGQAEITSITSDFSSLIAATARLDLFFPTVLLDRITAYDAKTRTGGDDNDCSGRDDAIGTATSLNKISILPSSANASQRLFRPSSGDS